MLDKLSNAQKIIAAVALLVLVLAIVAFVASRKEGFGSIMGGGSDSDVTTVHYHYTTWCGYCKRMNPIWERVESELPSGKYRFIKYDEDVVKTPGVKSFPTIFVERAGNKVQYDSTPDADKLKAFIMSGGQ